MKYYAVLKGRTEGLFDNWKDCEESVKGYPGAEFKAFNTQEEAEAYLCKKDVWKDKVNDLNKLGYLVAFTDGSYDPQLERYSYGVVLITPDGKIKETCGYASNKKYIDSRNVIGEIFGVINALDWAVSNEFDKIIIFHDYNGIPLWLNGEWSANVAASQMFVKLYKEKYEGIISVEFEKVPGHCNISYNERADGLAKSALLDMNKIPIQGQNWFSIPNFSKDDFAAFADIIVENDSNITYNVEHNSIKSLYKFTCEKDSVTVSIFNSGSRKLLVQGKNDYLFQVIATTVIELYDNADVNNILGSAYRISISKINADEFYSIYEHNFPVDYPNSVRRLIKQACINLKIYVESIDYSQYVFPALKALEGHMKYLIKRTSGLIIKDFSCFNRQSPTDPYFFTGSYNNSSDKNKIEICYNYYKSQRDTLFHFGELVGSADTTRFLENKDEANEIINKCLKLINEQM